MDSENSTPILYLVSGPPAAGKTTIARKIAASLNVPCISKDALKELLWDRLGTRVASSQAFAIASFDLMFVFAREVLASGTSVVLEANFVSAYDAPRVAELRRDLNIHCAELHVSADTNVLLARYTKRAFSDERHVGHEDQRKVDDARSGILNGTWAPLGLGREVAVVDTTLEWPDEVRELIRELNRNAI